METWIPDALTLTSAMILVAAACLTAAITAAVGVGGGVTLLVLLLYFLPPAIVLPLHGLVQLGANSGRAWTLRQHVRTGLLWRFAAGSIVGIALASQLVMAMPTRLLSLLLAAFILWSLWAPRFKATSVSDDGFLGVGAFASFLTMFIGATGPVVAIFLNVATLGKQAVVATHGAMMSVQHSLKTVAFGVIGFSFGEWMPLLIAMLISGYIGTLLGTRLLSFLPEKRFAQLFKAVLTLLALRLLFVALFHP